MFDASKFEQEQWNRFEQAVEAIDCFKSTEPNYRRRRLSDAIEAAMSYSTILNSGERLIGMLEVLEEAPPEIFWPVFIDAWPMCEFPWRDRAALLRALASHMPSIKYLSAKQRKKIHSLPPRVRVFRGCGRKGLRGVSWTIDRAKAEWFANRAQLFDHADPVVASAEIDKAAIFFTHDGRKESEIVLNPRNLKRLIVEPYTAK